MSDLLSNIKHRMLELMIVQGLPRSEATKIAAKEYGRKQIKTPKVKSPRPVSSDEGSAREALFSKVLAIRQRMFPDASPEDDMTHALAKPESMIKRAIARIRLKEDIEPVAPIEPAPQPVAATPSSTMLDAICGVYTGRSSREMLNQEFAGGPFHDDSVAENWRNSIEASKPRKPEGEIPADIVTNPARLEEYQQANIIAFPRVSK
jgi:hypothetical protein